MKEKNKKSFWEKLTGGIKADTETEEEKKNDLEENESGNWMEEETEEAELSVDLYQTPTDIVIQTMVAGVKPEDLEITIAREIVTIKGNRETEQIIDESNYFIKELYWGKFSRKVLLPQEVEPEQVEATEKYGLLTVKVRKVDKEKTNIIKVKST